MPLPISNLLTDLTDLTGLSGNLCDSISKKRFFGGVIVTHLHVEKIGSKGHPVLLLHGWGHSLQSLKPLGELIAHESQVHLIDLPGFGGSEIPPSIWGSADYADRILEYIEKEKLGVVDLIGHSFGGKVSMSLAARYPQKVRNLILMGTSGLFRRRSFKEQCRFQAILWTGKILKAVDALLGTQLFKQKFAPKFGSADYKQAGALRPILVKTVNEELSELIKTIKTPTLLLWGEQDGETPPEVAHRLHQLIEGSRLLVFPGKDHHLYKDVGSHLCAHYILPFLSQGNR